VLRERSELDLGGPLTPVPQLVGARQPDLLLLNDGDLTFAKIRLDERSLRTATESLAELDDSLARALLWAAAWDMTRDGEMRATDFLELVVRGVAAESDLVTVGTILRQAKLAVDQFAAPGRRPDLVGRLAAEFHRLMLAAEPGSDHQLAFARAFANFAGTPDELAAVRGLLDGSAVPAGLALDPDLRWPLLARLIALGAEPVEAVEAELARDATSSGERYAAALRAAAPTAEAKAEAWGKVVDADLLPNAMQTATIGGFQQADQLDLLRPYVARFFAQIPAVWDSRTTEMASNITVGLFPALLVEQRTADLAETFLAEHPQLNPAARRLVAEGRDGVLRALRAQACDAG
jgi:aminopeptidase N